MSDDDPDSTRQEFDDAVNMAPKELEEWLETAESRDVGQKDGGESTGHASGRRIVELLRTTKDELSDDDLAHMRSSGTSGATWRSGLTATSRRPRGGTR